tara:strand:- start:109 stop:561 length:453 start_codon:yes stop_codon:yes gene_type:complete
MKKFIILILFSTSFFINAQTKWSKCKFDKTKLQEALDGEVIKEEFNKKYIAFECGGKEQKHYYWVADEILSDDAFSSPLEMLFSVAGTILGTSQANYSSNGIDASDEIIPLIEQRKYQLENNIFNKNPKLGCAVLAIFVGLMGIIASSAM